MITNRIAGVGGQDNAATDTHIRVAVFDDYEAIAALLKRNGLQVRTYPDWRWLWEGNPAYRMYEGRWAIGWVLENEVGDVVGTISNIPFIWRLRGRDIRVAACAGWAVDSRYRRASLGLLQRFLRQDGVDLYVSTTANPAAESALRVFKWTQPPVGAWNRAQFWITSYKGFLKAVLAKREKVIPDVLCRPIAWLWQCADALRYPRLIAPPADLEVERRYNFDASFDFLWKRVESSDPEAVWSVRSSETLNWHFRSQLNSQRVWILVVRERSHPIAYAVFDCQDNSTFSLKRVRLVDFCAISRRQEALRAVLTWMFRECEEMGVHTVEIFGCWLDSLQLTSIRAPYKRDLPNCLYLYSVPNGELRDLLKDRAVWRPSSFDGDASL